MTIKDIVERARQTAAELRKYELVADPLPTIQTESADDVLARLQKGSSAAVLSLIDRRSRVGKRQYLVSPSTASDPDGVPRIVAVVTTEKAARFDSVDDIPADIAATLDPDDIAACSNAGVYVVPIKLVAGFTESIPLRQDIALAAFGPPIDISTVALRKGETTVMTGSANGHKHQAVFDSATGDGATGAPTDDTRGHTHVITGFKVQAGDEGHTHSLSRKQAKLDGGDAAQQGNGSVLSAPHKVTIVSKALTEERFVLGVVLEPDEVDSQGHIYAAEEVRKAAHNFLEIHARMGLMHKSDVTGKIKILESFVAPVDMVFESTSVRKGTWLLGARILDDELWEGVKNGKFNGWSIGGTAVESIDSIDQMLAPLTP